MSLDDRFLHHERWDEISDGEWEGLDDVDWIDLFDWYEDEPAVLDELRELYDQTH